MVWEVEFYCGVIEEINLELKKKKLMQYSHNTNYLFIQDILLLNDHLLQS